MKSLQHLTTALEMDPEVEQARVRELNSLNILDTPTEERFDRITRLAGDFFGVAICYVGFIDRDRQWYKSRFGICPPETSRKDSFCQYTLQRDTPLIIADVRKHPIGHDHPMVIGEPFIRFYAGVPLRGPTGAKIGTFCIVDFKPRQLTPEEIEQLVMFAAIVEREVSLGKIIHSQNELLRTREQLVETQRQLRREFADAAMYVRRMLPPPLIEREKLEWHFEPSTHLGGDGLGYRRVDEDRLAMYIIDVTGHGLGSALLAVTTLELLRSRQITDTDFGKPVDVLVRLNKTFQMKDHAGKFFSCWYGVFSRKNRTLTYTNAGHPPPLLLTRDGLTQTPATGPVLGVLPEIKLEETVIAFPPEAELYIFTDGLYELRDPKGGHGSYHEFLQHLQAEAMLHRSLWPSILQWIDNAHRRETVDDDVSLIRFTSPEQA